MTFRRHHPGTRTLGAIIALALALGACGGSDDVDGDRATTRTPSTSTTTTTTTTLPAPSSAPPPASAPATPMPAHPQGPPARVSIPSIEVDAPVVDLGTNPDGTLQVPDWLDAGWFARGPEAGQRGAAVVVGHVDSQDGPAVFYRLEELRPGDVVDIALDGGTGTVRYLVDRIERFPKDAFPTLDVYGLTPGPELRLITCDGEFDSSTGHYVDNLVVYATIAP